MDKKFKFFIIVLITLILLLITHNLNTGYLSLHWTDYLYDTPESAIANLRINRTIVMLLAGIAIPTSGFLLQEYFQNPLAGPSVLGITSASSLAVAFYLLLSNNWLLSEFLQNSLLSIVAITGSLLMMILLLSFSFNRENTTHLIIFGFLISALAGAIISILQVYADNQSLKNYILWSYGANAQVNRLQLYLLTVLVLIGLFFSFKSIKPLIGNSLGIDYAKSFGVNLQHLKILIILSSSLLSASVTAFLGPLLFIGIVVPHFCRMIYNPAKIWQQWVLNMLMGIIIMEGFSILSEITKLPINVITSVFGIPVIISMMINKKSKNTWS